MQPHPFRSVPIDSSLKVYRRVCGHVDRENRLVCVHPPEHALHVDLDAEAMLEREMRGAPPE